MISLKGAKLSRQMAITFPQIVDHRPLRVTSSLKSVDLESAACQPEPSSGQ